MTFHLSGEQAGFIEAFSSKERTPTNLKNVALRAIQMILPAPIVFQIH
jgi:hypothetical protein